MDLILPYFYLNKMINKKERTMCYIDSYPISKICDIFVLNTTFDDYLRIELQPQLFLSLHLIDALYIFSTLHIFLCVKIFQKR